MTERPYNIRPSRILDQGHESGHLNAVPRLLADSSSEETVLANRPYRGAHRAENTNYPDERSAARDRSSRVGRHHADHRAEDRHTNRR